MMNNKEVSYILSSKLLISASTYELIQAFEVPVGEFYIIWNKFSELAMINNRQLYSKVLKSDNYNY